MFQQFLANPLLTGIDKRLQSFLEDEEYQLAAAFHTRFHLIWLDKYDIIKDAEMRKSMESKVKETMRQQSDKVSSNKKEEVEDGFFSTVTHPKESCRSHRSLKDKTQNLVKICVGDQLQ